MSTQGPVIAIGSKNDPLYAGTLERLKARTIDHCAIDLDENWLEHVAFDIALDDRAVLPHGERICIGDRVVALDDIRGFLVRFLAWAPANSLAEPNGMFISSELSALVRFLSFRLRCPVINRLRADLWAFHFIDGTQVKRMLSVPVAAPPATIYASTIEPQESGAALHIPFSQPDHDVAVDGLPDGALERIVRTVPLRIVPRGRAEERDVYVVGDDVHSAEPIDSALADASRGIARALDLVLCRMAWAPGDDGGQLLRRVQIFPHYDYRIGPPLEAVCDSIAKELSQ